MILAECRPLFCIKIAQTWRHSGVICGQPMVQHFNLHIGCKNVYPEQYEKFCVDRFITLAAIKKKRERALDSSPPHTHTAIGVRWAKFVPNRSLFVRLNQLLRVGSKRFGIKRGSFYLPCPSDLENHESEHQTLQGIW